MKSTKNMNSAWLIRFKTRLNDKQSSQVQRLEDILEEETTWILVPV